MNIAELMCCMFWILALITVVVIFRRSRKKVATKQEVQPAERMSPQNYLLLGRESLQRGNHLAARKAFLHVYRHGRPDLREQAARALEEMGEVETF